MLPASTVAAHRVVDLRVAVAERVRADAHERHVDVFAAVEVPDPAALRPAEVRRPLLGQEHLGALGQQHVAAGNHPLRARFHSFCPVPIVAPSLRCDVAVGREQFRPVRFAAPRPRCQPKSVRGAKCSNTPRTTSRSSGSSTVQRSADRSVAREPDSCAEQSRAS